MQKKLVALFIPMVLMGCILKPYRMEIQQGNILDTRPPTHQGEVNALSSSQLSERYGEALIQDPFHAGRWDYQHYTLHSDGRYEGTHFVAKVK